MVSLHTLSVETCSDESERSLYCIWEKLRLLPLSHDMYFQKTRFVPMPETLNSEAKNENISRKPC